jgi:hypothetical protein
MCAELNGAYPYFTYYSKKTGKKIILNSDDSKQLFDDDITFNKFAPDMTTTSSGQLIYTFPIIMLLENIENYKGKADTQALRDKLKGLDEFDNPVVVLYTLKDF